MTNNELLKWMKKSKQSWEKWAEKAETMEACGMKNWGTNSQDSRQVIRAHDAIIKELEVEVSYRGKAPEDG